MSSITVVRVDSQLAMQIVSPASPKVETELVKATAHVVDDNNKPQGGVTVYWGSPGVNQYVMYYYDVDTLSQLAQPPKQATTTTGNDGTTSVYVGSRNKAITTVQASLEPLPWESRDGTEDYPEKLTTKTNNIAVCTFLPDGGEEPAPTLVVQEDGFVEPEPDTGQGWPSSVQGTVPVFPDVQGGQFVPWLWTSNDQSDRGDELSGIKDYNQQIAFNVPYHKMATQPNTQNKLAYMAYAGTNAHVSEIWSFQASGTGVVWPDPDHIPAEGMNSVQYVPPPFTDQTPSVPMPKFLSYNNFDPDAGTLNFAIPAYQGLLDNDDIGIKVYVNAWYPQGESNNQIFTITKTRTQNYKGQDFNNGYLRFFLTRTQLVDFCPYQDVAPPKYGCMLVQYVVNNTYYSPSPLVLISFCDGTGKK